MNKVIISSETLKKALAKVGQAIEIKNPLPVLQHIYCKVQPNSLELIGSNLDITIHYRVDCESSETFEFLIPFEFLSKIVAINKHAPLTIEAGKKVKVSGPNDVYEFNVSETIDTYPKLQNLPKKKEILISGELLKTMSVALATTTKPDVNARLSHVLLELKPGKICIASSDGSYSVYCNEFDNDQQEVEELLISSKAIKVLEGLNSVKMFYHKKAIGFENEELEVIITRSEDKFVDFRKVFPPDWPANTKVMKHELIEALGKCSLSSDLLKTTVFTLGEKQFDLMADDQYININVAMAADYTGDVKTIAINSDKLLKLLQQIEHSDIEMAIHDAKRAIVITCESDPGYRGMLMPIAV